ncbi:MAG: DUF721 domain-containing protein [Rickettsiales bacterium]|nr:DUF721 domain-containing protein [Rickettsiales bacterium]
MSKDPSKRYFSLFPKPLNGCIEPLIRPILKEKGLASSRLITQWSSVVGESLATRSLPEKLTFPKGKTSGGTLTIAVQNGFAPEIQHLQPIILEKLSLYFGYRAVERIVISHTFPTTQKLSKTVAAPKNKSTLPKSCIETANQVEDPELKAALASFANTLHSE